MSMETRTIREAAYRGRGSTTTESTWYLLFSAHHSVMPEPTSRPKAPRRSPSRHRLRLISILAATEGGEVCGCDPVEPLGRASHGGHHLKVLSDAGLVVGERRSKWVWYSIVPERLAAFAKHSYPSQRIAKGMSAPLAGASSGVAKWPFGRLRRRGRRG